MSYQANFKYNINNNHSIILSGGEYHGYTTPNYMIENFLQVKSSQVSMDYLFQWNQLNINTSLYYREDIQPLFYQELGATKNSNIRTYGTELSFDYSFSDFNITGSYAYLSSKMHTSNRWFKAYNSMDYLVKGSISYFNNK